MSSIPPFVPQEIVRELADHDVDYVMIGGFAATAWKSPYSTQDVDICPSNEKANLEKLAAALTAMGAKRVTDLEPEGVEVDVTPEYLRAQNELAFMTQWGPLDLVFVPQGTRGYEDLVREAVRDDLLKSPVLFASRDDVIRMKDARGLLKDRLVVDLLRQVEEWDEEH
jgi:hypothetical protein